MAAVNEKISALSCLFVAMYFSLQTRARTGNCKFVLHHDPNAREHENCPQLVVWNTFFVTMPLFLGQPRFFLSFLVLLITAVVFLSIMTFHHTSPVGTIILHVIYALHLMFVGALKFILERQERRRFAAEERLVQKLETIRRYSESLHKFVATLAPKHLHSRLATTAVHVDVSSEAVAVVSQIHDSCRFINGSLPNKAAVTFSRFNSRCEEACGDFGLHHIRTLGDTNYFVSNLFNADNPTTVAAAAAAVRFMTLCARSAPFALCTGVAAGTLTGIPLGRTCIRYDIFGTAMSEAHSLALSCPPAKVHFEATLLAKLSLPYDEESSTVSLKLSDNPLSIGYAAASTSTTTSTDDSDDGSKNPPPSALLRTVSLDDRAVESGDFNTNKDRCCGPAKFTAEQTRDVFSFYNTETFRHVFVLCNFFFVAQVGATIASVAEERHNDADTPLIIFFATMALSLIGFSALGIHASLRIRRGHHHESWHVWCFFVLSWAVSIGNHLSRPSVIGTSNPQFIWSTTLSAMFIGATIEQMLGFQLVSSFSFYAFGFSFRPIIIQGYTLQFMGSIVFSIIAMQQNRLQMSLFTNLVKNEEAIEEEQELCRIREAVQNSLLPQTIQEKIDGDWKSGSLKVWASSSCVVVTIDFNQNSEALATLAHTSPEELRKHVESTSRLVEDIVPKLRNGSLSIIKAFGGVMTVAGPLAPDDNNLTNAVSDTFELLQELHERSAGLSLPSPFTVAVASEQVINVLRLSEFPSYELMGPAVNISRAMANACPAPMTVVDEKLTQFYTRECTPSPSIEIGEGESWRLRAMGVVRVRHVRCQNSTLAIDSPNPN